MSSSTVSQQSVKHIFKRSFLIALIVSLVLSAIAGIIIFLLGTFDDLEFRILLTTLVISVFSITGLINASLLDRKSFMIYGFLALAVSIFAALLLLLCIWLTDFPYGQITADFVIVALACAHVSILLVINTVKNIVRLVRVLTFCCIVILAGLLIHTVDLFDTFNMPQDNLYYRLIGVFGILDALGSITTPILNRLIKS